MQEAFEKLKGVDIFALKSYLEKTSKIETSIIVAMNEIFVNLFFFLLNLVVGFFSLMIRIMENIDLYDSYKTYVYNAAKSIWQGLTGSTSGGLSSGSLVSMLLTIGAFYLFYQYFFSRGNFMRKVLHVLLVVLLGFGYFGTVASTSGGLYILDTVDNLADTVTSKISNISVSYGENKSIKVGKSMADSYIAQTSYTAYVFVNTGQENGKYVNNQTGEEEAFDDAKVLGSVDDSGKFVAVKNKDRKDYLDKLGDKADDGKEKNRWVSAVWDYLFIKTFYVIFKIIEAIVIAVPIILVQLLNLIAQLLVLVMILLFPIALLISFIPAMQDIIFGIFKVMFGGLVFPTITTLITLIIFYIEKVIETLITSGFDGVIETFPSLGTFALLFKLILSVVAKAAVYYFLWIYKGELIEFIMGSRARIKMEDIGNQVENKVSQGKDLIQQMPSHSFETAQHLGNFAMVGTGFVAGSAMNASSHIKEVGNFFRRSKPNPEPAEEPDLPTEQLTEQSVPTPDQLPPTSSEPNLPKQDIPTDKPIQEKTPTPEAIPTQPTTPPPPEMEFQELKEQWVSPRKQRKMERLERELSAYDDGGAMYQAQGSNAFTRSFRQTLTRDDKIKANIERKNRLTQELNRLRGEQNGHY
ncbi:conjugal transfer protein [Streptococcus thermophilus]|uniref:conjugal transfer protein n=1 Tax=Streptococcus thermophilus TaxID=1308 RepID=UPI001C64C087|nr:conjugal transfer protein [Streptococcus thermophilus]MBW7822114.1 conjugal transfer protein [Streptococcus thermophilus]